MYNLVEKEVRSMKKLLSAVICICMMFGMASCDNKHLPDSSSVSSSETTSVTTSASLSTTSQTAAPETTTSSAAKTTTSTLSQSTTPSQTTSSAVTSSSTVSSTTSQITTTTSATSATTKKTTAKTKKAAVRSKTTTTTVTTPKPTTTSSQTTSPAASGAVTTTAAKQDTITAQTDTASKLFYFPKYTPLYDLNKKKIGAIGAGCYYAGHYDPKYPDYAVIKYTYGECLVPRASVTVRQGVKILETAAIGQMGGRIWGQAACGPTAAAILVNSQLGLKWSKDDLILYCEKYRLNDQGSLRRGGGITAPKLITMIKGYSHGKVSASNIYSSNPAEIIKRQIDAGNRSIVVVQYTSYIVTHYRSGTHFVVICGYEYINGALYFYYADPYYSYNGRSLLRVSASVLARSMNMVVREPRCIITVK